MNDDDKKLYEDAKKYLNIGNLEQLAEKLEYAKTTSNNWYSKGFNNTVRLKIKDLISKTSIITSQENTNNINYIHNNIVRIPKLSSKVSAGYNIQVIDSIEKIGELILDVSLFKTPPPKKLFAMQVDGYSMIPMIFPDSWVIFDDCKQFKGDGLYIINWDDCLMVKQISATPKKGVIQIISANKDYQSWEVDLNDTQCSFMIFGKVIRTIL